MPLLFNEEIDAEKFSDSLRSCSSQSAGTGQTDAGGDKDVVAHYSL